MNSIEAQCHDDAARLRLIWDSQWHDDLARLRYSQDGWLYLTVLLLMVILWPFYMLDQAVTLAVGKIAGILHI